VIFIVVVLILSVIYLSILLIGTKTNIPFTSKRLFYLKPIQWTARCCLYGFGYFYINTVGKPSKKDEAPILIANHVSFLDPFFLVSRSLLTPIGAAEHLRVPILNIFVRALQTIAIDRKNPSSRHDVIEKMKERSISNEYPQLLIFPEGTTTSGQVLITFKPGAFIPAVPVQAVCLSYPIVSKFHPGWVLGNYKINKSSKYIFFSNIIITYLIFFFV
jgi:lysophosphatidylcholine acyltransferase/lyso-PAF acetyltransferase